MKNWVVMLAALCLFLCGFQSEGPKTIVHLVAPPNVTPDNWDMLVEETAQQLVAAELAARYGLFAQYWALDQVGGISADAFPRVEIKCEKKHLLRHLRLVRKGDTFAFLGSDDGKQYILFGQWSSAIPAKSFAGLYVRTLEKESDLTAVFADVRLNGREIAPDSPSVQIGKTDRPGMIRCDAGKWTIRTCGGQSPDSKQCGLFLYQPVEGDFVLEAELESLEQSGDGGWAGVLCRAGLQPESAFLGNCSTKSFNGGAVCEAGWTGARSIWNVDAHVTKVIYRAGPNDRKELGEMTVSSASWEDLCNSTEELSRIIREGVARELKLNLAHPARANAAKGADIAKLDLARKDALTLDSGVLLRASDRINEVLNGAPTCAEAHYTAALCGSLLACQDLFGSFHERGRFLAGPFSHMMLAKELSAPERPQEKLDCSWLMLACGFPDAASAGLVSLTQEERQQAEARALEMFVTRDYRSLTPETVLQAAPVEQLAWLWATQEARRTDLLGEAPQKMAVAAHSPAFLPLYEYRFDVGAGHVQSLLGSVLSCARDIAYLFTCEAIPPDRRSAAADKLKADLAVEVDTDPQLLEDSLMKRLTQGDTDDAILPAIPIVMDLYEAALASPAGPVRQGTPLRWQCLCAHDFAELQRGLTVRTLYNRLDFVGAMWGVNDLAYKISQGMSAGLAKFPEAADFVRATGLIYASKFNEGKPIIASLLKTPFGKLPSVTCLISSTWGCWYPRDIGDIWLTHCRGSWQLSDIGDAATFVGHDDTRFDFAALALEVDCHSGRALCHCMRSRGKDIQWLQPYLAKMPYDFRLLESVAEHASETGDLATAKKSYEHLIALAPGDVDHYYSLAQHYAARGSNAKAIDVAQQAVKNCPYTVGLSNLMGEAAGWLVKEGRPEEALKMGRGAAESYSQRGLEGLAAALAANGKKDEALQVYSAAAHRYEGVCDTFLQFLIGNDYPDEEIFTEMDSCLRGFETLNEQIASSMERKFAEAPAKYKVLERLYAGPLSSRPAGTQKENLTLCAMSCRQFEDGFSYMQQLRGVRAWTGHEVVWGCLSAELTDNVNQLKTILAEAPKEVAQSDLAPLMEYFSGRIPVTAIFEKCFSENAKAYALVVLGVDAERKGDLQSALIDYKTAAKIAEANLPAAYLAKPWGAAVEAKLARSQANAKQFKEQMIQPPPKPEPQGTLVPQRPVISFDGKEGEITVQYNPVFNMTKAMTAEAWIWADDPAQGIIMTRDTPKLGPWQLRITPDGKLESDVAPFNWKPSPENTYCPLPTKTWLHIAMVFDGSELRNYINGRKVSACPEEPQLTTNDNSLLIGRRFNGRIAGARLSNEALYKEDFTPPARLTKLPSTVMLLPLDEGQGITAEDESGNGCVAVIAHGTWTTVSADEFQIRPAAPPATSPGGLK